MSELVEIAEFEFGVPPKLGALPEWSAARGGSVVLKRWEECLYRMLWGPGSD